MEIELLKAFSSILLALFQAGARRGFYEVGASALRQLEPRERQENIRKLGLTRASFRLLALGLVLWCCQE